MLLHAILQKIQRKKIAQSKSENTLQNGKDFINFTEPNEIPSNHEFTLFDIVSLFRNVPIDPTIGIITRASY